MANQKISELSIALPEDEQFFVVSLGLENFKIKASDLKNYSCLNVNTGQFLEELTLNSFPVVTGDPDHNGFLSDDFIKDVGERVDFGRNFIYFSDFTNNNGITHKVYYDVPGEPNYISGVFVDDLSDCDATITWDGPLNAYVGYGRIHDQDIPLSSVQEVASNTRRFSGSISSLDLTDQTELIGVANDRGFSLPLFVVNSGPIAINIQLDDIANVTAAPGSDLGTTYLKSGDIINMFLTYNFNDYTYEQEQPHTIEIINSGLGAASTHTDLVWEDLGGGLMKTSVPVTVTGERNGNYGVYFKSINHIGISGAQQLSNDPPFNAFASVENSTPTLSLDVINYPVNQGALKTGESGSISYTSTNSDSITAAAIQVDGVEQISNITVDTSGNSISYSYSAGDYNTSQSNISVKAKNTQNGLYEEEFTIINIANTPLILDHNLPSYLDSLPGEGKSHEFILISDQIFNTSPLLSLDASQSPTSILENVSSGTGESENTYKLHVIDGDQRGDFDFTVSAFNLAGIETTVVTSQYKVEGLAERIMTVDPKSFDCGLGYIGAQISDISKFYMEDISESGDGPNGGTVYSNHPSVLTSTNSEEFEEGQSLHELIDIPNKYIVATSAATVYDQGDHFFNLDMTSRRSNSSTDSPARFIIREEF